MASARAPRLRPSPRRPRKWRRARAPRWNQGHGGESQAVEPQEPNRYVAVTTVTQNGNVVDSYETPFGIRTIKYDPNEGLFVNGEHYKLNGVCDHHDLGALGSAINVRALQRQLEILHDMGCTPSARATIRRHRNCWIWRTRWASW